MIVVKFPGGWQKRFQNDIFSLGVRMTRRSSYVGAPSSSLHTHSPRIPPNQLYFSIKKQGELRPPAWSSNYPHHHLKVNRGSWLARCPRLEGFPLWVSCSKEVLRQRGNCELCQIMGFRCIQPIKENWGGCLWSICSNLISHCSLKKSGQLWQTAKKSWEVTKTETSL